MTVLQLLKSSYRLLLSDDEPTADALSNGLLALNALLNEWSTRAYGIYTVTKESFTVTQSTASYTIGSGADFDTVRPIRLLDAFLRDSDGTDYDIKIIDREWYNDKPRKTTESIPYQIYYEPSFPTGTLYLYTTPDKSYTLFLDSQKALSQYASTAVSLALPPEYETALKFNVAVDWANELGVEPSGVVAARAVQTLSQLKALHSTPVPRVNAMPFGNRSNFLPNIYGDGRQ